MCIQMKIFDAVLYNKRRIVGDNCKYKIRNSMYSFIADLCGVVYIA